MSQQKFRDYLRQGFVANKNLSYKKVPMKKQKGKGLTAKQALKIGIPTAIGTLGLLGSLTDLTPNQDIPVHGYRLANDLTRPEIFQDFSNTWGPEIAGDFY